MMLAFRSFKWLLLVSAPLVLVGAAHASSFEDALSSAYQNNPQIKAAREQQQATDESVSKAVSGFRPTIGGTYSRGRQRSSFGGSAETSSNYDQKGLRFEQPLFRGGGTWSSYQSALQQVKSGQYQLAATEQNVLLQAATAYMGVVSSSAILELSRKEADVLAEQLNAANTRFQVGEVTRTDVAQSEARLSDAKSSVIRAEGDLLNAMATYEKIIGERPEGTLIVPEKLPELPASLDEALERARDVNPELLAAIHRAKASDYDVRTSQAALLPKASLVGTLSRQQGSGSGGNSDFDQDRIGVEVSIPLYQSGSEYARVREASAISRQRAHESIDTRRTIDQVVTQAWEQLESSIATIATRNEQIKAANLALDGVKQEQQYGSRTVLDVLNAERELFNARTNLVQAQRDRIVAAYALAYRLGMLTPQVLALNAAPYDPAKHADEVGWKTIGF